MNRQGMMDTFKVTLGLFANKDPEAIEFHMTHFDMAAVAKVVRGMINHDKYWLSSVSNEEECQRFHHNLTQ